MSVPVVPIVTTLLAGYSALKAIDSFVNGDYLEAVMYGVGAYAGFSSSGVFSAAPAEAAAGAAVGGEALTSAMPFGDLGMQSLAADVAPVAGEVMTAPTLGANTSFLAESLPALGSMEGAGAIGLGTQAPTAAAVAPSVPQLGGTSSIMDMFKSGDISGGLKQASDNIIELGGNMIKNLTTGQVFDKSTGALIGNTGTGMGVLSNLAKPVISSVLQDRANEKRWKREDELLEQQRARDEEQRKRLTSRAY